MTNEQTVLKMTAVSAPGARLPPCPCSRARSSGPLPSGFKSGRWLCEQQDRERNHKERGVEGEDGECVLLPAHLGRLAMAEQLEQASGIASIPLPTRSGRRVEDAGHPPAQRDRAGDRQADGPERMQQARDPIQKSTPGSMTASLEFLGPDHHVAQVERAPPRSTRRSGRASGDPCVQRWSQAATIAKNRPKDRQARERASRATS